MNATILSQRIMLGKVMLGIAPATMIDPAKFDGELNFVAKTIFKLTKKRKRCGVYEVFTAMNEDGTINYVEGLPTVIGCALAALA